MCYKTMHRMVERDPDHCKEVCQFTRPFAFMLADISTGDHKTTLPILRHCYIKSSPVDCLATSSTTKENLNCRVFPSCGDADFLSHGWKNLWRLEESFLTVRRILDGWNNPFLTVRRTLDSWKTAKDSSNRARKKFAAVTQPFFP